MKACQFYRGPSMIDGREIVAIATTGSENRKTGDLIQTWILRTSHSPTEAVRLGHDRSICGDCKHRGTEERPRTCYVNFGQAPQSVWRAFKARRYPKATLAEFLAQRPDQGLRMGSYGDPVAVPIEAWLGASGSRKRAGYTHQWRNPIARPFRELVMASCDSPSEAMEAAMDGWRTFLVQPVGAPPPAQGINCLADSHGRTKEKASLGGMIQCLADSHGRTCESCGLCRGADRPNAPSIWIEAHGTARRFV